jgi:class 3 adenylate cyclase/pimeloyl-ACP methyl ester carboxylesterase
VNTRQEQRVERRLAAIFAADVAGYSRLMSQDEAGTLRALAAAREIMDGLIVEFGGRIANTAGDSVLAEFPSAVDAVQCAVAVQEKLGETSAGVPDEEAFRFRIGIHVGDVAVRGGDLLGDGVNVAARVQALAEPGAVWLSEDAHRQVTGKTGHSFEYRGDRALKSLPTPLGVYSFSRLSSKKGAGARPVQEIRYCRTPDGVRLAWARSGSGPPLVKAANWLNHLQHDWESPIFEHLFASLGEHRTLYRYDARGNGLSDRDVDGLSLDAFVSDLETVVDAAALDRFPLFGLSQGCAVSIAYAVRHPERVSHLILLSGFAQGDILRSAKEREARLALAALARVGWDAKDPYFREMFAARLFPDISKEQMRLYAEQQRDTISGEAAARFLETVGRFDVRDLLAEVRIPTLVLQVEGDSVTPLHVGRALASGIPGARFVLLPGRNHVPATGDPAAAQFSREVKLFLAADRSLDGDDISE